MADKAVNPVTDAIRSVIGEYKSLVESAPKKKSPKVTGTYQPGAKKGPMMPKLMQSMEAFGITPPDMESPETEAVTENRGI